MNMPAQMKILAIDTSTPAAGVALMDGGTVLAESNLDSGITHSRTLLPEVKRLLDEFGIEIRDLTLVAVGLGPGSFTGLRIGLAVAKGLAWAARIPLVGVPTLDALARGYPGDADQICPFLDARRNQVYAALYRPSATGVFERTTEIQAYSIEDLAAVIAQQTVFFGPGVDHYGRELARILGDKWIRDDQALDLVPGSAIGQLAADLYLKGTETDPGRILPLYVRQPVIRGA